MSANTRVGVVTVTYNSGTVLDDFLASLSAQTGVEVRLYAVDNASADDTVEKLRNYKGTSSVTIIENPDNAGVAVGNNQGILAALSDECDWVFLLNNDTFFAPTVIADLVNLAELHSLDVVAPAIEATEPPHTIWYLNGKISPYMGMRTRHLGMGDIMPKSRPEMLTVNYASTCALLVRPTVFRKVGLMDPVYFVYGDDVDFCIRVNREGFDYWVAGEIVVTHKASSLTGEYTAPFAVRWITRNWLVVARRHCTPLQLFVGRAYMAAWTLARFATGRDSTTVLKGRLRAFREGQLVDLSVPPPHLPPDLAGIVELLRETNNRGVSQ